MSNPNKRGASQSGKKKGKGSHPFQKFIKKSPKQEDEKHFPKEKKYKGKSVKRKPVPKDNSLLKAGGKKRVFGQKEKVSGIPEYDFSKFRELAKQKKDTSTTEQKAEGIRLNRFISNSGVCSRREADSLIANGEIKVNNKVVTEMGYKVKSSDTVVYKGKTLKREKFVYVLLNKPKGFITTTKDPQERKTVMSLVNNACDERIYPVGRLDRATTGLLLFTNDGEFAKNMAHPSGNTQKVYYVELNRPLSEKDEETIINRKFKLEDGAVDLDGFSVNEDDRRLIGVELHSGRNRIVRRIFEHFGYAVEKLDRTVLAGLTKKDLPRGKWRYLNEQEIINLKFLKQGKKN